MKIASTTAYAIAMLLLAWWTVSYIFYGLNNSIHVLLLLALLAMIIGVIISIINEDRDGEELC